MSITGSRFERFFLLSLLMASALGCYEEVVRFDGREPLLPMGRLELESRRLDDAGRKGAIPPGTPEAWKRDLDFDGAPGSSLLRGYLDVSHRRVEETGLLDDDYTSGGVIVSGEFDIFREELGILLGGVTPGQVFRFGFAFNLVFYQASGEYYVDGIYFHRWEGNSIMLGIGLGGDLSPGIPPLRIYGHAGFSLNLLHYEGFWEGGVRLQLAGFFFTVGYRDETVFLGAPHGTAVSFSMRGPVFGSGITF